MSIYFEETRRELQVEGLVWLESHFINFIKAIQKIREPLGLRNCVSARASGWRTSSCVRRAALIIIIIIYMRRPAASMMMLMMARPCRALAGPCGALAAHWLALAQYWPALVVMRALF